MIHRTVRRGVLALAVVIAALFATVPLQAAEGNSYTVTRLVSDVPGAAQNLDPNRRSRSPGDRTQGAFRGAPLLLFVDRMSVLRY